MSGSAHNFCLHCHFALFPLFDICVKREDNKIIQLAHSNSRSTIVCLPEKIQVLEEETLFRFLKSSKELLITLKMVKRCIVNGGLLGKNTGENVSLTVYVDQEIARQSTRFSAKTTDDQDVDVNLHEPLNTPVKGWIEIIGIPQSANTIQTNEVNCLLDDNHFFLKLAHIVKY